MPHWSILEHMFQCVLDQLPLGLRPDDEEFLGAAARSGTDLPPITLDRIRSFAATPQGPGALLIRGLPTGELPATPATPTSPTAKDRSSEFVLSAIAQQLGEVVGYAPEHGGAVIQNLVPVAAQATRQTSTSSGVDLAFHTETAFHPYRPSHLVLLCLRGDPSASTTVCSVEDLVTGLTDDTRHVLCQPRFRCGVDESFGGRPDQLGRPGSILWGDPDDLRLWFDEQLMVGTDDQAAEALEELTTLMAARRREIVLEAGDCLIIDNERAVHGRSAFSARYDGTDRWLQRAFVVASLEPSMTERHGRIITTRW